MSNNQKIMLLKPAAKDYIWGGNRLNEEYGKNIDLNPLAETWECSTHKDGLSVIRNGINAGKTLKEVVGELPILIKFIDAKKDLSVQVHPDDEYADKFENGQKGKTEMWYVLDALPGSTLVYGFNQEMDADKLRQSLMDNTIEEYLNKVPVKSGDAFFIEAGTVHAIGAGLLIAEIQQNSNLTYRLYDYNRVDKDGNKRELHIDKSIDVAKMNVLPRIEEKVDDKENKVICECDKFKVSHNDVDGKVSLDLLKDKFQVILCLEGRIEVCCEDESVTMVKGDCLYITEGEGEIIISGQAKTLLVQ